jgi:hypothetical protein
MPDLSPAAQAVLDAFERARDAALDEDDMLGLAAALIALADQVVPHQSDPPSGDGEPWPRGYALLSDGWWEQRQMTRAEILAIAAELEGEQ